MSNAVHSLEFELALSCSALDKEWVFEVLSKIEIATEFSENDFLLLLRRHHLSELAFQMLNENSFFSKGFHEQLKQQAALNQLKSIKGLAIQIKLQEYFEAKGIDAIFLKGILLSHLYYGDIAKRNLVDIDVWVPESRFSEVKLFLDGIGYSSTLNQHQWSEAQLRYIRICNHDEIFIHQYDRAVPVLELHWKLRNALGNFIFDPLKDQHRLIKVELAGVRFQVFDHVDQFIFLCVHGAEHGWFKIKWLVDLYHLVKTVDLDWTRIVARTKELSSLIEVRLACNLLGEFYGLKLSEEPLLNRLTLTDKLRLRYIRHLITYDGAFCDSQREKFLNVLYTLSLNRRFIIPKELLLKNLTNKTDWLTLPLQRNLFFLYFPLRPFLWLFRKVKAKLF